MEVSTDYVTLKSQRADGHVLFCHFCGSEAVSAWDSAFDGVHFNSPFFGLDIPVLPTV